VSGSGGAVGVEEDAAVADGGEGAAVVDGEEDAAVAAVAAVAAARSSPLAVAVAVLAAALGTGRATTLSVLFARSRAAAVFSTAPRSSSYFVCSAFNGGRGRGRNVM
jgi:hypothetical protein